VSAPHSLDRNTDREATKCLVTADVAMRPLYKCIKIDPQYLDGSLVK